MVTENYRSRAVIVYSEHDELGIAVGTGFRVSDDAILTAAHVVENGGRIRVRPLFSEQDWVPATPHPALGEPESGLDLAVLRVPAGVLPEARGRHPAWLRIRGDSVEEDVEVEGLALPAKTSLEHLRDTYGVHGRISATDFTRSLTQGTVFVEVDEGEPGRSDRGAAWRGASGAVLVEVRTGQVVGVVNAVVAREPTRTTLRVTAVGTLTALADGLAIPITDLVDQRWARWALPPARTVDPALLGVRPVAGTDRSQAAYVRRDIHPRVVERLTADRYIVIDGDAAAGKTRLAYESLREAYPDLRILKPGNKAELKLIIELGPQDAVLWLDDYEQFLGGADGLSAVDLDRLRHRARNVVVATLRNQERNRLVGPDADRYSLGTDVRTVLDLGRGSEALFITRGLSATERQRAAESKDRHVLRALNHDDEHGFGAWLGNLPLVADEWHNARLERRFAAFLVAAAVDFRRAGYHEEISAEVLIEAAKSYDGTAPRRGMNVTEELDWACRPVRDSVSFLNKTDDGFRAFDYLVDDAQRKYAGHNPVTEGIWRAVLRIATPRQCLDVGRAAVEFWNGDIAIDAFQQGMAGSSAECANELGILLQEADPEAAEAAFREAVRQDGDGNPISSDARVNLAYLLARHRRLEDAIVCLEEASDELEASILLARILGGSRGRSDEAGRYLKAARDRYERAVAEGDSEMVFRYGIALFHSGRPEDAVAALIKAHDMGRAHAAERLSMILHRPEDIDLAIHYSEKASLLGSAAGAMNHGSKLSTSGRLAEAVTAYERAIDLGDLGVAGNLGLVLTRMNRPDEADEVWRKAADSGYPGSAYLYGAGRARSGDIETAEKYLHIAADGFRRELRFVNPVAHDYLIFTRRSLGWDEERIDRELDELERRQLSTRTIRSFGSR